MTKKFIFTLLLLIGAQGLYCQGLTFSSDHKGPIEPAFEKIYVSHDQLVTFADGVYYFAPDGTSVKARTVSFDEDGMFIITINHQCPLCGRCWSETTPDEEYDCPIFKRRVHPKIWAD
jgi:hypothetical protein